MKVSFDYDYHHNEYVAVYIDECGDRQVVPFDTFEQATSYLQCCSCKIGVMTTCFYEAIILK